jgi:MoaA/NifB/PqqE/SkfB family radical SAM enzyme/SAM-dependent methyltransferase
LKALIKVGYGCNEHCTFCHTLDVRHIDGEADEVHRKIDRAKQLGHTMVVLSGGEPTIRPELLEWAAHVARLDMDFGLITNGQMLAYPKLIERLRARRLRYVYMSLHGGTADVHNRLTRADGFERSAQAVRNLAGTGVELILNTVITRQNVDHLIPIVDFVLPYPDITLKLSMVAPKGGGEKHFESLMPRVSEVAARVCEAIGYGQARAGADGPRFAHDGIPLCLLPGYEDLYEDLRTDQFATMVEIGEPDFFPVDDVIKVQPDEICGDCALRGPCPGLFRGYRDAFGDSELSPRRDGARSNSFNYVFEAVVADSSGDPCPLLAGAGVTPWDRGRHLLVRDGGRVSRYRAATRDFADVEIAAIKHELGQVYLDRSDKPAPDDFARDLAQLRRAPVCDPCPERDACTGMYDVTGDDVFGRDDARVRELVAALRGDVLDLGCGEGPYGDALAPLAESGAIRYVGVDPDGERIAALRQRWPWAELHAVGAESLDGALGDRRFDHALVLRSWNHLRDPRAAADAIAARLRPGGTLTIVDNVAFGLVRTRGQAARAEAGPAVFEHFRNDEAADADRAVARPGLQLLEMRPVTPATSNQWFLHYRAF